MTRAAVVIGVDKTGGLDKLEGAANSAIEVAAWFEDEGYDVSLFTDKDGEVHAEEVRQALERIVTEPAQYELLVVYFSGHGFWHAKSDLWLFSAAPDNTADAINLESAMDVAKNCGIATVVFISDACRNIPGRKGQRVEGIDALPNVIFDTNSKVDSFKATSESSSAYEARIPQEHGGTGERESVMTKALRYAYLEPPAEMIAEAKEDGVTVKVVPNRKLEDYLQDKVDELLAAVDPNLQQTLEINVPSRDHVYMAKAQGAVASAPATLRSPGPGRIAASAAIEAVTGVTGGLALDAATANEMSRLLPRHEVRSSFETECGFVISDGFVAGGAATHGAGVEIMDDGEQSGAAVIRMHINEPGASVVVQLEDGRSFVAPALHGYIGHVTLDEQGVANIGYVPSRSNYRFGGYAAKQDKIDQLRALVAVSVDHGTFKVTDEDAWKLADSIRVEKALDPSLGLYAAHAYSAAGLDQSVTDVLGYMSDDLGTSLYDLVLLSSRHIDPTQWPHVPFCPMLTQSWNLVRPRRFELHPLLAELKPLLRDSLWTTFDAAAAGDLLDAVERGELT
jgi:tetrahydromethanopterin S-methyltransferase subunit B